MPFFSKDVVSYWQDMTCYLSYLSHWVKQRCKLKLLFPYFTVLGPGMGGEREVQAQEQSSITTSLRFVISRNDVIQVAFFLFSLSSFLGSNDNLWIPKPYTLQPGIRLQSSFVLADAPLALPIQTDFNRSDLYRANHICLSDIGWVCCDWLSSLQDTELQCTIRLQNIVPGLGHHSFPA